MKMTQHILIRKSVNFRVAIFDWSWGDLENEVKARLVILAHVCTHSTVKLETLEKLIAAPLTC